MMKPAPLYEDVAKAPKGGAAYWLTTADDLRIRIAVWDKGSKGTVLLFPGRTEYVEKYGQTAGDLQARGYGMVAIDWRGQGLADRMLDDKDTGHVMHFADYQHDVKAMVAAMHKLGLPEPYYLMAHSMGGTIGLRSLTEGLEVRAAFFSAPMWGILMSAPIRPVAWGLSWVSRNLGLGHKYAPGTQAETYVASAAYEGNLLTTDADMYAYMKNQVTTYPQLALGGPSMHWLFEALTEAREYQAMPSPDTPIVTFLGTNERIIDAQAVKDRMARWPNGQLEMVKGAEHEILMETPETRKRAFDVTAELFGAHR